MARSRTRRLRRKRQTGAESETQIEINWDQLLNLAVTAAVTGVASHYAVQAASDNGEK